MKDDIMRLCRSFLAALAALSLASHASAEPAYQPPRLDAPLDLSTPEDAVRSLFRAMYLGDAELVDRIFLEDGQLRRVTNTGEIRPDGLPRWRGWVSEQAAGDAVEEIFDVETQAFGNLATVWAPFIVAYKGNIVGCGVNTFTLAKIDGDWRIVFGMDTAAPEGTECETFKETYREG